MSNNITWPQLARDFDKLGEEQKMFEKMTLDKFMPGIPIIARLDGKAFHTFTKGLNRPFDVRMQTCMKNTMVTLCEKFQCDLGYSQSDEITLVWYNTEQNRMIYDGRSEKFLSLLAATASVQFYKGVIELIPEKASETPVFDCRVFQITNPQKVFENILWRWLDARKNSVSMLASSVFSVKELLHKSSKERKEMLKERGIDWNEISKDSQSGYFCKRREVLKRVEGDTKENIVNAVIIGDGTFVVRKKYSIINVPSLYLFSDLYGKQNSNEVVNMELALGIKTLRLVFSDNIIPLHLGL